MRAAHGGVSNSADAGARPDGVARNPRRACGGPGGTESHPRRGLPSIVPTLRPAHSPDTASAHLGGPMQEDAESSILTAGHPGGVPGEGADLWGYGSSGELWGVLIHLE